MPWSNDIHEKIKRDQESRVQDKHPTPSTSSPKNTAFALRECIKPVSTPPALWRLNGFGAGLYGWLDDRNLPVGHIKLYFISALWIPIIPLCAYVVTRTENGFRFYGYLSLWSVVKIYRGRVIPFYATALLGGIGWVIAMLIALAGVAFAMKGISWAIH